LYRSLIVSDPSVMNTLFQMVSCPHLSFWGLFVQIMLSADIWGWN
jgi:hypothetical protein